MAQDRLLVGAAGRLSPEKGFDMLIRCVAAIIAKGIPISLAIIGDGSELDKLQSLIDELGVGENIRLAGFQSDMSQWYEAMDVFALSSLREGLPNVILEAMALETPIVSTKVAGVPRIIKDGVNGLIVPIDDEDAFTSALERLIECPDLRKELAKAGRAVIERSYSFEYRMRKISEVYDSLDKAGK